MTGESDGLGGDAVGMSRYRIPEGPFLGARAVAEGAVTKRMLSTNRVRRVIHGVYVPAGTQLTYPLKCEAATLMLPRTAVLTGRSAAAVRGMVLPRVDEPVEVVVNEHERFGPVAGLRIRRTALPPADSLPWRDIRIATHRRMVLDIVLRHAPRTRPWSRRLRSAVADVDAIIHSGLATERMVDSAVRGRTGYGIKLARDVVSLVDGRAESPPESEVRVVLTLAGIPPAVQWMIHDGTHGRRLDLAYPEHQVAVEYDGMWHDGAKQSLADARRRERLAELGWRFVLVRAEDLHGPSERLVERVRSTLWSTER